MRQLNERSTSHNQSLRIFGPASRGWRLPLEKIKDRREKPSGEASLGSMGGPTRDRHIEKKALLGQSMPASAPEGPGTAAGYSRKLRWAEKGSVYSRSPGCCFIFWQHEGKSIAKNIKRAKRKPRKAPQGRIKAEATASHVPH